MVRGSVFLPSPSCFVQSWLPGLSPAITRRFGCNRGCHRVVFTMRFGGRVCWFLPITTPTGLGTVSHGWFRIRWGLHLASSELYGDRCCREQGGCACAGGSGYVRDGRGTGAFTTLPRAAHVCEHNVNFVALWVRTIFAWSATPAPPSESNPIIQKVKVR